MNRMSSNQPLLSIIIPTHNLGDALSRNLGSLQHLKGDQEVEVLFVDDASTDETFEALVAACAPFRNWRAIRLERNSGSPSRPRNTGIQHSRGEFIFFLDGDDEIEAANVIAAAHHARDNAHDLVRGSLWVHSTGEQPVLVNAIPDSRIDRLSKQELVTRLVEHQSMGCMAIIRRSVVIEHQLTFDEEVRMGEDLRFMADVVYHARSIGYLPMPLFTYRKGVPGRQSATRTMGGRELREFASSWTYVQARYLDAGVNFLLLHGVATISYGLKQMVNFGGRFEEADFELFCRFVQNHWETLEPLPFAPRARELLLAARGRDIWAFRALLRRRLVIAGHDLKFIKGAHRELEKYFEIQYDEWAGERSHDLERSKDCLAWGDVVWVEWMTLAAEWYSRNVAVGQQLIIRAHFYEITRDYGFKLDLERVGAIVAIAVHTYEDLVERFGFPREKVRLIPNFYETEDYAVSDDPGRTYRLLLVGAVPARKGLARAYELLRILREVDDRYTLTIFGKRPEDFGWIHGDQREREYFEACDRFAAEHKLNEAIEFEGWVNTKERLGDFGFVLSVSDFEGSHVAPGEAFCALNEGVFLEWRGVRYVYPERTVFRSISEMATFIRQGASRTSDEQAAICDTREFIRDNQGVSRFASELLRLVRELTPIE